MPKTKTKKSAPKKICLPHFWAIITLVAFPSGWIVASWLGYEPVMAFAVGGMTMLAMLVANHLAEDDLWIRHPLWKERFEHEDVPFRLAVITGSILLMIETALIALVLTDGGMDASLLKMIAARQCPTSDHSYVAFCQKERLP